MKKTFCVALALSLALLCGCGSDKKPAPSRAEVTSEERQFAAPSDGDLIAIFTTNLGEVRAVLYPDAAPMAVYNFATSARRTARATTLPGRSRPRGRRRSDFPRGL